MRISDWSSAVCASDPGEYRREGFKIGAGEPNSYSGGSWATPDPFGFCTDQSDFGSRTLEPGAPTGTGINCTNPGDPVYNILQPGSNGITGLPPEVAGKYTTDSKSLYAEATAAELGRASCRERGCQYV